MGDGAVGLIVVFVIDDVRKQELRSTGNDASRHRVAVWDTTPGSWAYPVYRLDGESDVDVTESVGVMPVDGRFLRHRRRCISRV